MKCQWKQCTGIIGIEGRCLMCARTPNTALEEENDRKKAEVKTDRQTNSTDSWRQGKIKRKYG